MELRFTPQRILKTIFYLIYENGALYKTEHMMRAIVFWGIITTLWLGNYFSFITSVLIAFTVYVCIGGWKFVLLLYSTLGRDMRPACMARGAAFFGLAALFWCKLQIPFILSVILAYVGFYHIGGDKQFRVMYRTLARDLRGLYRLTKMKLFIRRCRKTNSTVGHLFQRLVTEHPEKICFMQEDRKWTFQDVENYSNQVANCFSELGYTRGDDVAVFMDSKIEFIGIWLGLSKIGVIPALINSNLRMQPLAHSITVVNCKSVIFGSEMLEAMKSVSPLLSDCAGMQYFCLGDFDPSSFPARSLESMIKDCSTLSPPSMNKGNMDDRLFYVYTSGTTGMPKAAIIRHSRFMWLGAGIHYMNKMSSNDVVYTALPLYHTAGGILSVAQTVLFGNTVAIRSKFSASRFWDDCIKYEATVAQYIGELCRYLLAQPEKPQERKHKLKLMFGNGLRPQIWKQFVDRFNIPNVGELYGSTEGNANVVNIDNKIGAVGFMSRIIPTIYPVSLIKVEPSTGEPVRDERGLCIRCEPGEPGEFVGKIIVSDPLRQFDGYVNQSATKKKIVRDCFQKGDMAFLSGDMLVMDEDGYLFFVDRTGDTFRWRGENVSTMEIEGVISNILGLTDSVVYGVAVPDVEGRAGMAVICDPDNSVDLKLLLSELSKVLPAYAIPQFIRVCDKLESTGTFKLKKVDLQKEGFNPAVIKDPLYYLDKKLNAYVKLDAEVYSNICSGRIRM